MPNSSNSTGSYNALNSDATAVSDAKIVAYIDNNSSDTASEMSERVEPLGADYDIAMDHVDPCRFSESVSMHDILRDSIDS